MNFFDDAVEALDDQAQPASTAPANPYLEGLDSMTGARTQALRNATIAAHDQQPDRAAEVGRLAQSTGLAPEVVERNFDDLSKRVKVDETPYQKILAESPHLAEWASDPHNQAVAKDDMEQLGLLEWIVTAPSRAFAQSVHQMRFGQLRTKSLYSDLSQEESDLLHSEKYNSELGGQLGSGASWFRGAVTGTAQFLANVLYGTKAALPQIGIGATTGAVIGGAGGLMAGGVGVVPGAIAGAKFGAEIGGLAGGAMFTFNLEAGLAYDEYLGFKDELGKPLDPDVAKVAALATGAINAGLEVGGLEVALKTIPGLEKLGTMGVKSAVKSALRNPTVRAALGEAVKSYGKALTAETATEVAQRAITILSGEIGKFASGQDIQQRTPSDVLEDLVREGSGAVQSFALGLAAGPAFGVAVNARKAQRAAQGQAFFDALAEGVTNSKTVERMPEAAQAFLEKATAGGPVERVYAPVDTFATYWQGQGLDPSEVAAELTGDRDAFETAQRTGEDLAIPTARYAVKMAGTEHHKFFAAELRLGPDEMNAREAEAFQEQIKTAKEKLATPELSSSEQVRKQVTDQLTASGVPTETAAQYAALYEGAFGSLADRAGMDPAALYGRYGLTVERPALSTPLTAARATEAPTASFLGHMDGWDETPLPLYNIQGGEADGSTVSAERLAELGIAVPETPPFSGEKLSGEQIRSKALASRPVVKPLEDLLGPGGYAGPEQRSETRVDSALEDARYQADREQRASMAAKFKQTSPAARDNAAMRERVVDKNVPAGETDANGAPSSRGNELQRSGQEPVAQPGRGQEPGGGAGPGAVEGGIDQIPPSARAHFADLLTDARARGYAGDDDSLAARYLEQLAKADAIAADLTTINEDHSWKALLSEISKAGGISFEKDPTSTGELEWFADALGTGDRIIKKSGRTRFKRQGQRMPFTSAGIEGAPGIIKQKGGHSFDGMREHLAQDPRWAHLEDVNDFNRLLEDAVLAAKADRDGTTRGSSLDAQNVLEEFLGVKPGGDWWTEAAGNLLEENDLTDQDVNAPANAADTSFNVEEFGQGLFDELQDLSPTSDTLATGEQQARLPGDTGAVREQEVATPQLEAPFALTSEVSQRKGKQTELFQPAYHGSPHVFEKFSMHAIGTGEGAQSYGWGLYFAGKREVAERYREKLASAKDAELTVGGQSIPHVETGTGAMLVKAEDIVANRLRAKFANGRDNLTAAQVAQAVESDISSGIHYQSATKGPVLESLIRQRRVIEQWQRDGIELKAGGRLYTVEIPEDDAYLDYDKPASEQSPKVQQALKAIGLRWEPFKLKTIGQLRAWFNGPTAEKLAREDIGMREALREGWSHVEALDDEAANRWQQQHQGMFRQGNTDPLGRHLYDDIAIAERETRWQSGDRSVDRNQGAKLASETLARHDVAGIRYLDGMSRANGEGSSNYVLFDDRLIDVTEFNQAAQPLTPADVADFERELREKHGADLALLGLHLVGQGDLELAALAIARGAQRAGLGTTVMQDLTRFADQHGVRMVLSPGVKDDKWGTTSRSRLVKFYKRFGFVENKGRRMDYSISAGMYRDPTVSVSSLAATPASTTVEQLEAMSTDEAMGVNFDGAEGSEFPDGTPAVVCTNCAEQIIKTLGRGEVFGWEEGTNPTSVVAGPTRGAQLDTGQGHDFAIIDDRFLVDPWAKNVEGSSERAAWDLTDPADRAEVRSLYGDPTTWKRRTSEGWVSETPGPLRVVDKTKTPAFRAWFKDSKVVDASGAPLVVHHGTGNKAAILADGFSTKLIDKGNMALGAGFYFTNRDTTAKGYTSRRIDPETGKLGGEDAPGVLDVYLSIQKPIEFHDIDKDFPTLTRAQAKALIAASPEFKDPDGPLGNWGDISYEGRAAVIEKAIKAYTDGDAMMLANDFYSGHGSAFLKAYSKLTGYDGVITHFPNGETHYVAWFPEQIKSVDNRGTFDATDPNILNQGRRGSIRFGADRQFSINLFERADLSTFLHETGHFFLEVAGDLFDQVAGQSLERLSPQQKKLLADYGAILEFLGVKDRSELGEAQHEQFARAFESYLMEGKAPSLELQSAFSRFRAWLVGVYRSLKSLNVNLTDDVRQVFDRMVATDRAIAEAQQISQVFPIFTTPEAAGMSPAEFSLYRSKVETASRTARETLERKLLSEVQREQTQLWKDTRDGIETAVAAEVHGRPVYQVLAAMQKGTRPDGTLLEEGLDVGPLRLSRAILVERYGADRLKRFPKPYIYSTKDGLDPDGVAQMFGFSSGDEMLTAVEQAAPMKQVIQHETDRRMLAEHGSILLDGTLIDQAQAALSNEDQEIVVRAELRALGQLRRLAKPFVDQGKAALGAERKERAYERRWMDAERKLEMAVQKKESQEVIDALTTEVSNLRAKARGGAATIRAAIPPAGVIRDAAKARIGRTRLRELKPQAFWSASRRAAQQAIDHAARQDFDAAIVAKQQELINLALYREAERALEDARTRVKRAKDLGKGQARSKLGLAGEAYLDQVDGILDRYEFATVSRKVLDRRSSLRRFVAALEGEGLPVDLPEELLEETRRTNYQELTIEELTGVLDGLDQIVHLARLKNRLLKNQQQRELDQVAGALTESIRDHARHRPSQAVGGGDARDRRPSVERRRMIADFFGGHRKLASMLREMDGFEDGGAAWEAVMRPLNDAANREAEMTATATKQFATIVERAFPGKAKSQLYTKTYIPAVNQSLSRMERIMVAMNWGNDGNRDRVRRAEGWNDAQVRAILDTLSAGDLRFVQDAFDLIDGYWPEIEAKQTRVYGIAPEKVQAVPIQAAAGEIPGGYFPLKYDDRLSAGAIKALDLEAANMAKQAAYAQASTKRGHTKERVSRVKLPVRRDFGVMFEHVAQVIHDLSHHEALIDVGRVLGHADVQAAILETQGDLVYKQIRNTIRDVAFGDIPAVNGFERAINHVRVGATVAGLGWNLGVALLQPIGLTNSMARIGPKWVAKGIARWIRSPSMMVETVSWIEERSDFMRSRGRTQQREIAEVRNAIGVSTSKLGGWVDEAISKTTFDYVTRQGIADSYFWMIQQAQRVADVPTWLGQYEKSLAGGETEDRAVALADQAVLDSQGGGQTKDLAQVQRGGPMMKLWTNFYSYFNVVYNQAAESRRRTRFNHPAEVGRLASDYFMLFIVPATLGFLVREAMRPGGKKDEDEEDFALRLVLENISYLTGTMLGAREVSGAIAGSFGYEGPAGARAFAALGRLGQQVRQGEADQAFWRSLNDVAGVLLHYPASQAWKTSTGVAAVAEGRTSNPGAVVAGPARSAK